jgi:endonuclease/exonuclease/phosphatase (EEP) superfamily protein YafD
VFGLAVHAESEPPHLKILTLNAWKDGGKVSDGLDKIAYQIKRSEADIVLLQEAGHNALNLGRMTGMYFSISHGASTAILSRFPLLRKFQSFNSAGAVIHVGDETIGIVSIHLTSYSYGPYYACLDQKPDAQVMAAENRVRGYEIEKELKLIQDQFSATDSIIIGGDFNSPSHLDWVEKTKTQHCGRVIPYLVTQKLEEASFKDVYREVHPDPEASPGLTWSPVEKLNGGNPEPQDRIDMIHYRGRLSPVRAEVFLDDADRWPSDHAGVLAELR